MNVATWCVGRSAKASDRLSRNALWSAAVCAAIGVVVGSGSTVWALDPTLPVPGRRPAALPSTSVTAAALPPAIGPVPAEATDVATKPAIPDAASQAAASKTVDQVYKELIAAARSPEQKKQLCQKFLKAGNDTTSDLPGKYVLLVRARDLAADLGDVDSTLAAIGSIEKSFATQPGAVDLETISRLNKNLRGVEAQRTLGRYLLGATNDAVALDNFELAKKLVDLAYYAASHANEPALLKWTGTRGKEVREVEAAYLVARPSLEAVAKGSIDPAQSLAAGRYQCLYKGDWSGGLPLLAAGSDPVLKDLATKELAGTAGADLQLAVADAWWAQAEQLQGLSKNLTLAHARSWYEQAEPYLTGLPKDKAVKRLKETESLAQLYSPKTLPQRRPPTAVAQGTLPGTPTNPPNVPTRPPEPPPTTPDPATPVAVAPIKLPPKFTREWKSPAVWLNKPELVTIVDNKVTILNEGGTNTVCKEEEFLAQKDGTLVLQWNYGDMKSGFEIWGQKDGEISIQRWNSKEEKDAGKPARRVGVITSK